MYRASPRGHPVLVQIDARRCAYAYLVCGSVLQHVAMCCSVLQRFAVCCRVLPCVTDAARCAHAYALQPLGGYD